MKNIYFLLFAAAILIFNHSWLPGMFMDGGIYVTLGKNAALFDHWLVPHFAPNSFNQFFEHPPTLFIFEGVLFKIFGVSWTVARLSGFLFNVGTIVIMWLFLSKERSRNFAFSAVAVLLLCLPYLKKSRFPNLDMAMTLFIMSSLFMYYKAFIGGLRRYWIGCGVFFGMAALMKGHPALFIPMIILIHLIITSNFRKLLAWAPWYSFVLGLCIFALWPLSQKIVVGNTEIFESWFQRQFLDTLFGARGGLSSSPFVYFKVLFKGCLPWLVIAAWGARKRWREPLFLLCAVWFLTILVSLSCVGWKLGHYILPLYPALAIMTAFGIESFGEKIESGFARGFQYLMLLVAVVLLCFPVSNEIRRNRKVYYAKELIKTFREKPTAFAMVGNPMDYWNFAPAVSFPESIAPYRLSKSDLLKFEQTGSLKNEKSWMFLVSKKIVNGQTFQRLEKILEYNNAFLLVEKRLLRDVMKYPYRK